MAFIPYSRQQVDDDDIAAVAAVLRSEFLTQGPQQPLFEAELAAAHGVAHAVAVSNATSALHLACLALGVGPGSRVWTSPISYVASSNCALYCGATVDFVDIAGAWTPLSNGSPAPRSGHSLIWTGTEMIVRGGTSGTNSISGDPAFADGARFGPATGNWIPLPSANAPSARWGHSTIWTGTEMIVWGGQNVSSAGGPTGEVYNTGARYNPATNTWSPTSILYAPLARSAHSAVWTGTEMTIWGGTTDGSAMTTDTAARYNPATDTWTAISQTGSPSSRKDHKGVWTGSEMIIWNLKTRKH